MRSNEFIIESTGPADLKKLAAEFQQNNPKPEGNCAKHAKAFSEFLTNKNIDNKIIDARRYKVKTKEVGNSNHVLAAVGDHYADFTWFRFDSSSPKLFVAKVSDLTKAWKVVNTYKNYQDFESNFSREQK